MDTQEHRTTEDGTTDVRDAYIVAGTGEYLTKNGSVDIYRTTAWSAPGCHNGCGVLLHVEDGEVVRVEGDPSSPFNEGRLCPRCLAIPAVMDDDKRLLYPIKRAREDRGKDKWERVSWDEAYDLIESELRRLRDAYGAESLVVFHGTGRDITPYNTRFAWSYGTPNLTGFLVGCSCYLPRIISMASIMGTMWLTDYSQQFVDRYDNPLWEPPEVLTLWGCNFLNSNSDGNMGYWIIELMKRGTKIINIDPRVTWTGSRAAINLRVRPGTDAALALGMLRSIIDNDLYDHEFVEKWCYGFDELAERVREYDLDEVAKITWLKREDIEAAARMIATTEGGSAMQWGLSSDLNNAESTPQALAMASIWAITGNVDNPGGNIFPIDILPGGYAAGWGHEILPPEQKAKKIGLDKYPMYHGSPDCDGYEVLKAMETEDPYPIKALFINSNNFMAGGMIAEPERTVKALQKLEFIFMADPYMTPTGMMLADVILPVCMFPERSGVTITTGVQRAGAMVKVVEPKGEARSDQQIYLDLGKRFKPEAWPWDTVEDMFSEMIKAVGYTYDEAIPYAPIYPRFEYYKYEKGMLREDGQPGFPTKTGRIELWSTLMEQVGLDPLPSFTEPYPSPYSTPEYAEEYPLILTTGTRRIALFHTENRSNPYMRRIAKYPVAWMNPADAAKYGLEDGDWLWLENYLGKAKRKLEIAPEILEGTVSTDHGWWFPEKGPEEYFGFDEVNVNKLLPYQVGKSGFGSNYKAVICKVYKA